MAHNQAFLGEGYVPAYQMSAMPFVTSSNVTLGQIKEISFGSVTRFFEIKNLGLSTDILAVGFTQNGLRSANSNFFVLSGTQTLSTEIRTDRLFISGVAGSSTSFSLLAGLTGIQQKEFLTITGSSGFRGVG
jgi:hypothetical protein